MNTMKNSNHALEYAFSSRLVSSSNVTNIRPNSLFPVGFEMSTSRVGVKGVELPLCFAATYLCNWRENVSVCVVEGDKKLLAPRGVMNYWTMARIRASLCCRCN